MTPFDRIRWRSRLLDSLPFLSTCLEWRRLIGAGKLWRKNGWFVPVPHFLRRASLLAEARDSNARVFVETGTFRGDTTRSLRNDFDQIYTIEVQKDLASLARERFRKLPHIQVVEGDSSLQLESLCKKINQTCLFYLDGHDSGGITGMGNTACPVLEELQTIFTHTTSPFRIVIDDARLFGSDPAYPTISEIRTFVSKRLPNARIRVEIDAIFIAS